MHNSIGLEDNEEVMEKIKHRKSFLTEFQRIPINKIREEDLK